MCIIKQLQEIRSNIPVRHLAAIALLVLAACANPVAPTGGPRDTDPPLILRAEPENGSIHFDTDEIRLLFDEFIQLKGLSQQFLSSPPFQKVPETRIHGKTLTVKLEESLRENTTYTLFFGDAISDFNEGNAIPNYRYVFSTGAVLDSMELKGRVINAKTLAPEKEVFVMLYDDYRDSIPLLERPYYISRTNDNGEFTFTNLRNIPYKVFALRDVNSNLIYDQPNEEIAFLSELIHPVMPAKPRIKEPLPDSDSLMHEDLHLHTNDSIPQKKPDAEQLQLETETDDDEDPQIRFNEGDFIIQNDTTGLINDSTTHVKDSIDQAEKFKSLTLFLFTEVDSTQRLERSDFVEPSKLQLVFRFPVKELVINPLPPFEKTWKMEEMSPDSDTLTYWLLDIDRDSLFLEISALNMQADTVKISLSELHSYREQQKSDTIVRWLNIKSNFPRSGAFDIHEPVRLSFSEPLESVNLEKILLLEDSVVVEPEILLPDELQRMVTINYPWQDTTDYKLFIPDSVFKGIYGHYNDTLQQKFKTRMLSEYGNLNLNIEHSLNEGQLIILLVNDKDQIIRKRISNLEEKNFNFMLLLPGNYKVRVIHDKNSNNQWDTGVYMDATQPERVYEFDKNLELRGNWDLEETFVIPGN